jgi:hypothetical protein
MEMPSQGVRNELRRSISKRFNMEGYKMKVNI